MKSLLDNIRTTLRWWVPFSFGVTYGAWVSSAPIDIMICNGGAGLAGAIFLYHKSIKEFAIFLWDMRPLWL